MSVSNLLAISGSLRAGSINTEVLRAAAMLAPPSVHIRFYDGLAGLPHFNPDLDAEGVEPPGAVRELRGQVAAADAILICSPEYAHGVPGTLKNALDWLVSGTEILYKPIGLLNASPVASHAHASLAETLRTMSTMLVAGASIKLPITSRRLEARSIAADSALAPMLRSALAALVDGVAEYRRWQASVARPMV